MNTGEHVWMVPNGDGPLDHPAIKHLNLGPLGVPGRPSPLLTKTLLFIGEGLSNFTGGSRVPPDMPPEIVTNSGGNKFRAYDKNTGDTLWEFELDAGTSGPPVSYMFEGRQYIVVAIGDPTHGPELVAFSLTSTVAGKQNESME
jgi:quinoprotein glucose dehydrogenase